VHTHLVRTLAKGPDAYPFRRRHRGSSTARTRKSWLSRRFAGKFAPACRNATRGWAFEATGTRRTDPVLEALRRAPLDDFPESEEEREAVAKAKARCNHR
jgi:hypothetical protein